MFSAMNTAHLTEQSASRYENNYLYKTTAYSKISSIFVQAKKMSDIDKIIRNNGGYITTREAKKAGRSAYYELLARNKSGALVRIRPGVYSSPEVQAGTMIDIRKVVPDGVLCLYSAWLHYGLTTQIPTAYYVAIDKHRKVRTPDYPPITICYWSEQAYKTGIINARIEGLDVPIYDIEKSVCDALRYRNKIGIDVSSEILRNYLSRSTRNLTRLMKYAKALRVAATLKKYLEIQL